MNRTTEKSRRKSISAMKDDKRLKRKVRNSYIVSTVSITLVLFLLGSVGYLMAPKPPPRRGFVLAGFVCYSSGLFSFLFCRIQ